MTLLDVRGLRTHFFTDDGIVKAVDDLSFSIAAGETLALVGESGCGKSMTALSLLRLVPEPPGRIVDGEIWFEGRTGRHDLCRLAPPALRAIRGREIAMIFQEPMTALNPVMRIGEQIAEALTIHLPLAREVVQAQVVEGLARVGIPEPARRMADYPHQLSGGMRQRAMIAMALACRPRLLIADEPTTALDVTIQAQILHLLRQLQRELQMAMLLITHDLGVVAAVADRVAVMYAGMIVEVAPVETLFSRPRHPYTVGLLQAIPTLQRGHARARLATIPGRVPHLARLPVGCPFQERCPRVTAACREALPELASCGSATAVRCIHPHGE
ncbi:MAG: ABC transporter ATP-binding protein [Deltaproteobacteria bacterium]|nr:ABC transporter ATP-binding protein [Deltaproteobacteria bacterium]